MNQPYNYGPPMPPPQPAPKAKRSVPLWVFILALVGVMFASCTAGVGMGAAGSGQPVAATESADAPQPIQGRKATSRVLEPGDEMPAQPEPETIEPKPKPEESKPELTVARQQAIDAAASYLEFAGFSRAGLIDQLTSEYGEGFALADAKFAVAYLKPNWKAEAVEAAESYLDMDMGFSRAGLVEQLSSEYGEGFTREQAEYAADQVGL